MKIIKKLLITGFVFLLIMICTNYLYASDAWINLFNGNNLDGWKQLNGKAKYEVVGSEIVGTTVPGKENSFLVTEKTYFDFVLEIDLFVEGSMNSGIQFRSLSTPDYKNGQVHGYQCEVDPSTRAWSGGIYDEARRGWLYPLTLNPEAGKAFKQNAWNHYRIECIGTSIRTWINGIATAHLIDDLNKYGFIALQVHSVSDGNIGKKIRWKNIRLKTTGLKPSPPDHLFIVNKVQGNLSDSEKAEGWKWLWDGKTTKGWRGARFKHFPKSGWEIENGVLSVIESGGEESQNGGDIITKKQFSTFELQWDFMLSEGANSGVKYFVNLDYDSKASAIGLEFQLQDDEHSDNTKESHVLASLYELIPAQLQHVKSAGLFRPIEEWNHARIVVNQNNHVEHWLNGIKVLEYTRGDESFKELVENSKYARWEGFGQAKKGHILLQDHGNRVSFRNIKIKNLD